MASLNEVTLIGNVGMDVEIKEFDRGGKIAKFSMATTESYKRKDGEKIEHTSWHNVVIRSEPLVRIAQMFVAKGSSVCIKGKIIYRDYEKNGEKRKTSKLIGYSNYFFTHGEKAKNLLEETSQFHGYKTFKYIVKMLSF